MSLRRWRFASLLAAGIALAVAAFLGARQYRSKQVSLLMGTVLRLDPQPQDQMPIAGVQISAVGGASKGVCTSDSSGLFRLRLRPAVTLGEPITLQFRHP